MDRLWISALAIATSVQLFAQSAMWGTDFLISFGSIISDVRNDSVYVDIVPSEPTQCTLSYTSCTDGHREDVTITASDPRRAVRVKLPRTYLAQPYGRTPCGVIRLRSTASVLVYAFSNDSSGGEAAIIFPTTLYGKTYVVPMTLRTNVHEDSTGNESPVRATILATDASDVVITAGSEPLRVNGIFIASGNQHRVVLESGEQCLIETRATDTTTSAGIIVQASNPVGVVIGGRSGKELFFEHLLAAEYWDTTAVVMSFPQPVGAPPLGPGYAIIAAIQDSSVVRFSDGARLQLNAGESTVINVAETGIAIATNPIMVLALRQQSQMGIAAQCLALVPPLNAGIPSITLLSPQVRDGVFRVYSEQYVGVVADRNAHTTVRFDGAPWNAVWEPLGDGTWQYSIRRVGDDVHQISTATGRLHTWAIGYGQERAYATCSDFAAQLYPYLRTRFRINDDTISTRDTFRLCVELSDIHLPPSLLRLNPPARVRFRLRWNATVATPLLASSQSNIENGYHVEWIESKRPTIGFRAGDTVAVLPLIAALGELPSFRVEIDSVIWYDDDGRSIVSSAEQDGGRFVFNDVWEDQWGKRLVSPMAGHLSLQVVPNPVESDAVIVFPQSTNSESVLLELYNAMGSKVAVMIPDDIQRANGQMHFLRGAYPAGVYFLRLVRGSQSLVVSVMLQ